MQCHLLVFWISMDPRIVPFGMLWITRDRHAVSLARVLDLNAGIRYLGFTRGWCQNRSPRCSLRAGRGSCLSSKGSARRTSSLGFSTFALRRSLRQNVSE